MPWTPMAVSAWRTSSSLNGLMIATTSFMVRPYLLDFGRWASGDLRLTKSGIFLGKWHKKVASGGKTFVAGRRHPCTGARIVRHNGLLRRRARSLARRRSQPGERSYGGSILVLCIRGPAAGSVPRDPAPRADRPRHDHGGYAGLDRGHGQLAAGGGNSGPRAGRLRAAGDAAFGQRLAGRRRIWRRAAVDRSSAVGLLSAERCCTSSESRW